MTCIAAAAAAAPVRTATRWWALGVVLAAQFMFVVDAFIVNVAIPSIRAELGAGEGEIAAVVAIYQLAYATMVITGGRLGDILGRRAMFVAGILAFTLASLWCGLAGSAIGLVLARLAQGAAAALMVPQVLATIHALFPDGAARARAFAVFGVALGLGGAAGFLLGGWLLALDPGGLGWRSVFLVNLPVGLAIAAAAWRLLPPGAAARPGTRLDLPGAALLFLALLCLVGPLLAGPELGWPWWLPALGLAGLALLPALLALQRAVARRGGLPLLDLGLLADRAYRRGLAAVFAFQLANIPFYLAVTLLLQEGLGYAPQQAGTAVAPLALAFTLAAQLSGRWTERHGLRVLLGGCLLQVASLFALAGLAWLWPALPPLVAALTLFGFGQGLVMAPLSGLVLGTVRPDQAGAAAGVLNTVHQVGGALGVSLLGTAYFAIGPEAAFLGLALPLLATAALLRWRQAAVTA
jgi:EmrB/QacA subfamily drug resistance transporter